MVGCCGAECKPGPATTVTIRSWPGDIDLGIDRDVEDIAVTRLLRVA
jgi:hypothetical protein